MLGGLFNSFPTFGGLDKSLLLDGLRQFSHVHNSSLCGEIEGYQFIEAIELNINTDLESWNTEMYKRVISSVKSDHSSVK